MDQPHQANEGASSQPAGHDPLRGVVPNQQEPMEASPQQISVEELPLEKKLEVLRKHNQYENYDLERFIDAQDSVNTWCLGQISEVDQRTVRIHFDGWSTKWDITTKINNYKVAPFRKYSRCYTGQQKIALRQNMKFSLDELNLQKQRVQKLIDDDLNGLGAFETTQYFRGQLYIYVDFLLQGGIQTSENADAINDFIYNVLRLIVTWIKKLPRLIPLYSQLKVNSDLFLIDENIAILQSQYELMDILKKIFCGCQRCFKYYMLNDKPAIQYEQGVTQKFDHINFEQNNRRDEDEIDIDQVKDMIINRRGVVFGQFLNFLNHFAELGGFDALIDAMKAGSENDERMPLEMISLLVSPFRTCNSVFAPTFAATFTSQVKDILLLRLQNMTEKELKEIDKESVTKVLNELRDFFTLSMSEPETAELIEMNQLSMALRFLKSTYLEKRLKGISDIKLLIERIDMAQQIMARKAAGEQRFGKNQDGGDYQFINNKGFKNPKYLNAETLRDWIISQKVLEIVFGDNTHLEIVKRSSCILKFLAKQGALPGESIDLLWKCQLGKHEEMVRVVYATIQELVPSIDVEFADQFFSRIQQVSATQYDDKFLDFLRDFTQRALENYYEAKSHDNALSEAHPASFEEQVRRREIEVVANINSCLKKPNEWSTEDKQYGLPIFWELIQDRAPQVTSELSQQAIECLTLILKQSYSQPVKISYLIRALENLQKGESVAQSVIIAKSIIADYPSSSDLNEGCLTQQLIIQALEQNLGLISKLISNIEAYNSAVRERVRSLTERKKAIPEDVSKQIFVGKHSHDDTLNFLLDFLEFLILNSENKVSIGTENIDRLWQMFVQQPNFNSDQNLFLKWINKVRESGFKFDQKEQFLFNDLERKHFFTKILCNPTYVDFQKISIGQVKCFQKFFKVINKQEGNIEQHNRKMLVKQYDKLIGLDTLQHIAVETENERSREECMDLLVDLHLKIDSNVIPLEGQTNIWGIFIEKCMNQLDSENETLVVNTLTLLSKFLDRYEGKKSIKPDLKTSQYNNFQPSTVLIILRPDMIKKQVQFTYFQTVGFLRTKIAEAFGFQINEFSMIMRSQYVDPDEDDDRYLREFGIIQQIQIAKNPNYIPENHPKYLIAQKQENYNKLFTLLSKETKSHLIEASWELLQKLPVNQKLQTEIKDLSGMNSMQDNRQIWEKILDPKSVNKLLYSLQIVNAMQGGNRKDQKAAQWRFKFVSMGGIPHLLRTFLSLHVSSIESNLTLKCIELLIITLHDIMSAEKEREQQNINLMLILEKKDQVILTCIKMVDLICEYCISIEKKRGESHEEIQKRIILNKLKKNKYKSYMASTNLKGQDKQQQEDEEDLESSEYTLMQQILKQFNEQYQIISTLFKFMQVNVFQHDKSAANTVANYENLSEMLLKATVRVENQMIRTEVLKKIRDIINMRSQTPDMAIMLKVVKTLAFNIQPETETFEQRCVSYYDGITTIIETLAPQDIEGLGKDFEQMIHDLSRFILNREIQEKNTHDIDNLLIGKMKLLKALLQKFPLLKTTVGEQLTMHLVHNCLFEIPQGGTSNKNSRKAGPPKCKSQISRGCALKLLAVLCRDSPSNLQQVLEYLNEFNQNPSWRTNKEMDWNISLMDSEKSSTGCVGLKNLGCICYMNSLFQQLFMVPSFRSDILSVDDSISTQDVKEENILYQLQLLFAGLLKSEKQYVSPKGFCHAFKDWEGNPTNVLEQMDVEEFFNMLMDRLETALKGSPQQNTIQYHFGGKFASEMICKGCPHKYERSEPFLQLSISVKNQKSIQQSLNTFIQGEMLEGDNAYLCEKCDKKVDTLKRTCIKKLPKYLIVALRRFEFDYDKMIRVKVNDYCEFPLDLNLEPYTQEGLSKRERIQKLKEEKGEEEAQAAIEEIENEPLKYPKEYYEFSLSGIVVHSGTADSGHYYSFIKDREHPETGKWYEMNDHIVRDFDPNDIPSECFGGEDVFQGYNMMQMKTMKWRNAYLLLYERKVPVDIGNSDDEKETEKTNNSSVVDTTTKESVNKDGDIEMLQPLNSVKISNEIESKIAYENQKYWQNRFLFGNEYHEFVYDIGLNWNTSQLIQKNFLTKNNDFHIVNQPCPKEYEKDPNIPDPLDVKIPIKEEDLIQYELQVFKFAASFYLTILQRASSKNQIPNFLNLLKAYINKNEHCAYWLIEQFCNNQVIEEMFLQCSGKEMRKFTAGLVYCALLKVYPLEKHLLMDYFNVPEGQQFQPDIARNKTICGNLALVLIRLIFDVKRFVTNSNQFFHLFARLSSLGPEMRCFLLNARVVGRLMEFFYDDCSPHKEFFRDMSDILPIYKEHPEIGLPTQIDRKQMNQFQEILERKRMKQLAEGTPKYKYLFEAVSNLMRSFTPNGEVRSPYQTDILNFSGLIQKEKDLYFPEAKFLKMLFFPNAKKNRAIKALCTSYCHYTWNDPENYNELLNMIQQGLNEADYDQIKPFLTLIWFLLQKPGGEKGEKRFERTILFFIEIIEGNQHFYKYMETVYEFIFKLAAGVQSVQEWFKNNTDKWSYLVEWAQKISFPVSTIDQTNNVRLYKRRQQYQQYPQQLKAESFKNQFVKQSRWERVKYLLEGRPAAFQNELELTIADMEDYKFKVGEHFEIYYKKTDQAQDLQVEVVLDEMVQVKYLNFSQNDAYNQQNNLQWLACDSDKLQPYSTWKNQFRVKFVEHFEKQHENKMRAQNAANQMRGGDGDHQMMDAHQYPDNGSEDDDDDDENDMYT